jgi:hypothetical protein
VTVGWLEIDEVAVARCRELGVERCTCWLPPGSMVVVRPVIDAWTAVARRFAGPPA